MGRGGSNRIKYEIGYRSNYLEIIAPAPNIGRAAAYLCKCHKCGQEKVIRAMCIKRGQKTCGCANRAYSRHGPGHGLDLTNRKFGLLTAKYKVGDKWYCECECGGHTLATSGSLMHETTRSCGCLVRKAAKEGVTERTKFDGVSIGTIINNKPMKNSTSGVRGVNKRPDGRWTARISVRGKRIVLGYFDTLEEATAARKEGEKKYFAPIIEEYEQEKRKKISKKYRGVDWDESRGMWRARIKQDGKDISLGWYANHQDALNARTYAERRYASQRPNVVCIMCDGFFKIQIDDRLDRCVCHRPECWELWQKWRKANNDFARGKRKTKPIFAEWKKKHVNKDGLE
jgi:hypothetical protein